MFDINTIKNTIQFHINEIEKLEYENFQLNSTIKEKEKQISYLKGKIDMLNTFAQEIINYQKQVEESQKQPVISTEPVSSQTELK